MLEAISSVFMGRDSMVFLGRYDSFESFPSCYLYISFNDLGEAGKYIMIQKYKGLDPNISEQDKAEIYKMSINIQ